VPSPWPHSLTITAIGMCLEVDVKIAALPVSAGRGLCTFRVLARTSKTECGVALVASGFSVFSAVNRSVSAVSATFVFDNAFGWADSTMLSALSCKNCVCLLESFGCAPAISERLVSIVVCAGDSALTWPEVVGIQRLRCLGSALLVDTILSPTTWFAQPCGGVVKVASTKREFQRLSIGYAPKKCRYGESSTGNNTSHACVSMCCVESAPYPASGTSGREPWVTSA